MPKGHQQLVPGWVGIKEKASLPIKTQLGLSLLIPADVCSLSLPLSACWGRPAGQKSPEFKHWGQTCTNAKLCLQITA